jgi:CBS-domain-containing membrane protein
MNENELPPMKSPPVAHLMTSHVRTASTTDSLRSVWQILLDERCHHVPIVDRGRLAGIISTRDLLRVARERGFDRIEQGIDGIEVAKDVMSTELVTVQDDDPVEVAIDRIADGRIHALLVVDQEGALAGIVTDHDLLYYLGS